MWVYVGFRVEISWREWSVPTRGFKALIHWPAQLDEYPGLGFGVKGKKLRHSSLSGMRGPVQSSAQPIPTVNMGEL